MPTETEAKNLWCPFGRSASQVGYAINRYADGQAARSPCLATSCMAWRWNNPGAQPTSHKIAPPELAQPRRSPPILLDEPNPRPTGIPASWTWFPGLDWGDEDNPQQRIEPGWVEPPDEAEVRFAAERIGYCGLAGMPR